MTKIICGVDVSKDHLDASLASGRARVANAAEGIAELIAFCRRHGVELVVLEATGGYERLAFSLLWEAGLVCAVVNPHQVCGLAEALGFLEKTDRIDAAVIARYGELCEPEPRTPADANQDRLRALVIRLRQLTAIKTGQTNQRRLVRDPSALASIDEILSLIKRQVRTLSAEIAILIGDDPLWQALDRAFHEIKGVADRTVATLMAEFAEIGTISNKAAGKLAGLAPMAKDSGKHSGKRRVRGGRRSLRAILFVVADVVRRHNPDFADFHRRLSDAGKSKKEIRIALARKLLVRLNAKARDVRAEIAMHA